MRAGVTEVVSNVTEEDLQRRDRSADRAAGRHGSVAGQDLRVRRRQGRRRHDDGRGQRRDGAREVRAGRARCSSTCTSPTATRRCFSAPSRDSRSSTRWRTPTASTSRSSGASSSQTKAGVDLLASSDRVMLDAGRRAADSDAARVRRDGTTATSCWTCRGRMPRCSTRSRVRQRIVVVANQELATVRSASRIAAALRQRYGKDKVTVVVSRADRLADIGHEDVERAVGSRVKHSFPSDYRRALAGVEQGRARSRLRTTTSWRVRSSGSRSLWPASKRPAKEKKPPARFSLFGIRQGIIRGVQVMTSLFRRSHAAGAGGCPVAAVPGAQGTRPQRAARPPEPRAAGEGQAGRRRAGDQEPDSGPARSREPDDAR